MRRRRPQPPDPDVVSLVVDGIGALSARVWRARPGVADLDLGDGVPTGALDGRDTTMVVVTGKQIEGRLEIGWRPGHVRFVRHDVQRRAHPRAEVAVPALLLPDELTGMWRATTRDVGVGGALLSDAADVPLGTRLELLLEDPDPDAAPTIRARAQVVRAPAPSLRAVRFEVVSDLERERLQRLIAVEQVRRLGGD